MNIKSRIVFPLDVRTYDDAMRWMDRLQHHVGVFKIGLELFTAVGPEIVEQAYLCFGTSVFLDLKLHDIPATMVGAVQAARELRVDYLTIHTSAGPEAIEVCVKAAGDDMKLLGVTVLTSLNDADLNKLGCLDSVRGHVDRLALLAHDAGLRGFVCSPAEAALVRSRVGNDSVIVVPGVRPSGSDLHDQKRVATPTSAIRNGATLLVVGRPIRNALDPVAAAKAINDEIEQALASPREGA